MWGKSDRSHLPLHSVSALLTVGIITFDEDTALLVVHYAIKIFNIIERYLINKSNDKIFPDTSLLPLAGVNVDDFNATIHHQASKFPIRNVFKSSTFECVFDFFSLHGFFALPIL